LTHNLTYTLLTAPPLQQAFLDFVLSHYVLIPLLRLQYHDSIADAVANLGRPDEIGRMFSGFQRYLYEVAARATILRWS
jgi:type I restriction enzyme R subunit